MEDTVDFLGRGWSFPPRFDGKEGKVELVEMEEDIRESLFLLLSTTPGERVTNPGYGCNMHDLLYKPLDKTTKYLMRETIKLAVTKYEPRVNLEEIYINSDDLNGTVFINLEYTIRKVNIRTNIVYPFYKLEGTDIIEV